MTRADLKDLKFRWQEAILQSGLHDTTKLVALEVSTAANGKGENSHIGTKLMAQHLGKSIRTIKEHLKILREAGWIIRIYGSNQHPNREWADVYNLALPPDRVQPGLHPIPKDTDTDRVQNGADRVQPRLHTNSPLTTALNQYPAPYGAAPAEPVVTEPHGSAPASPEANDPFKSYPKDWKDNPAAVERWIESLAPGIDGNEQAMIWSMSVDGRHPRQILNTVLKTRRENL